MTDDSVTVDLQDGTQLVIGHGTGAVIVFRQSPTLRHDEGWGVVLTVDQARALAERLNRQADHAKENPHA